MAVDNIGESWFQRSTANQEAINVYLLAQVLAVLLRDTATVDDSGLLCNLLANLLLQPSSDSCMDLLGLLSGGNLAGTNGPDGLVGDDNLRPVCHLFLDSLQLACDDLNGLVGLSLLKRFTTAEDNTDSAVQSSLGFRCYKGIIFLQNHTALRVAKESPGDVAVLELVDRDLAGEGSVRLVEDILGRNLDARLEVLTGEEEVESWGRNDDL